jgi:hypothetical protein
VQLSRQAYVTEVPPLSVAAMSTFGALRIRLVRRPTARRRFLSGEFHTIYVFDAARCCRGGDHADVVDLGRGATSSQ